MRRKGSRRNKDQDGELYMNVQQEEVHSDTYSRPHSSLHRPEGYRTTSSSTRALYGPEREILPRTRHDDDWRHADLDHEGYSYSDPYSRAERDEYGDTGHRSKGGWANVDSTPYTSKRHDWSQTYNTGSTSSYAEHSSWGVSTTSTYESTRNSYADPWQRDRRETPLDEWTPEGTRNEQVPDRRQHDWHHENRRDKNAPQKFQSDSGWGSRRRDRVWNREPSEQTEPSVEKKQSTEDRSWEPAPSWKSNHNDHQQHQHQRGQNGQRNNGRSKRVQNQNKQKREWRADDGDLNNWTRRDSGHTANKVSTSQYSSKRKHPRSTSPSRSRSRSPTNSYRSHRSSRGRSPSPPSPTFSPLSKRRRRDSSPVGQKSRTPSERGMPYNQGKRHYSKSPSPSRSLSGRRSSISNSSGSERSKSPAGRTRSLHRLPAVNHGASVSSSAKVSNNASTSRKVDELRNGKPRSHKRDRKAWDSHSIQDPHYKQNDHPYDPPLLSSNSQHYAPPAHFTHPATIAMPPPPSLPLAHTSRSHLLPQDHEVGPRSDISSAKTNRPISMKGAGFKPIAKASSAVKKFFPGDEDEMEFASEVPPLHNPRLDLTAESAYLSSHDIPHSMDWRNERADGQEDILRSEEKVSKPRFVRPEHRPPLPSVEMASYYEPTHESLPGESSSSAMVVSDTPERQSSPPIEPKSVMHEPFVSPADNHVALADDSTISSPKDLFKIINQVGEGTFGQVYKARNTLTNTYVALKRIRMESERDGFPVTAMREIKLLQSLRHPNVVRLYEMMVSNGSVYMVFEYMDHDLTGVLSQNQFTFSDAHLKSLCHQMLSGLAYLHHKGVIHRDIKGSNILINNRGELKLADFGLARFYQKRRRSDYTNRVITLWYRPPELLFGATVYGPEVDMWSAGCIMLELFTTKPVFQGADEIHQVEVILKLLGSPTPERWPDAINLPWFELVKPHQVMPNRFREAFQKWMSPAALDLAERLLEYDPMKRVTASQAMEAPYFHREAPTALAPVGLVNLEGEWHELETKRERAKRKEQKTSN